MTAWRNGNCDSCTAEPCAAEMTETANRWETPGRKARELKRKRQASPAARLFVSIQKGENENMANKTRLKHMGRRGLSFFLALVMCISLVQITAFAEGGIPEYNSTKQIVTNPANPTYYDKDGQVVPMVDGKEPENYAVSVHKTIQGVANGENQFDITLSVTTTESLKTLSISPDAAVVLVMDVSNSMKDKEDGSETDQEAERRIYKAKEAAKLFLESYAKVAENYKTTAKRMVSIVEFGSNAKTVLDWTNANNNGELNTEVTTGMSLVNIGFPYVKKDNHHHYETTDSGGTNIQGGLQLAKNLVSQLQGDDDYSSIETANYHVILLTDGAPTFHISSGDTSSTSFIEGVRGGGKYTKKSDYNGAVTAASGAKGVAKLHTIAYAAAENSMPVYPNEDEYTWNESDKAWYHSKSPEFTTTVGEFLGLDPSAAGLATTNCAHASGNTNGLNAIYQEINRRINTLAQAWTVTDPMGDKILLDTAALEQTSAYADHYVEHAVVDGKETITWHLKSLTPNKTERKTVDGKTVTYSTYQLTYHVTLDVQAMGSTQEGTKPTNGTTILKYVMSDESGKIPADAVVRDAAFEVPAVQGNWANFSFTKVSNDKEKSTIATYNTNNAFSLTYTDENGVEKVYYGAAKNGIVSFSNIPSGYTYTLKEETQPSGYLKSQETKTVVVSGGVAYIDNKPVNSASDYKFVNELDPQNVNLTIRKTWYGGTGSEVKVTVEGVNELNDEEVLNTVEVTLTEKDAVSSGSNIWEDTVEVPTKVLDNGVIKTVVYHAVDEETVSGYELMSKVIKQLSGGSYEASLVNVTTGITVTKNWVDGSDTHDGVTIRVYNGAELVAETTVRGSKQLNLPVYDASGNPITYTVCEVVGGREYSSDQTGNVEINGKKYDVSVSGTTVTNTIHQETIANGITVNKTWNVGSTTPTAEFELYANGDPTGITTTITAPATSATLGKDLPRYALGDTVGNVTLPNDGSDVTYTVKENKSGAEDIKEGSDQTADSNDSVSFTNTLQKVLEVEVTKVWDDENNANGTRPHEVTLVLSGGNVSKRIVFTDTAGAENSYYTFDEVKSEYVWLNEVSDTVTVPKYDSTGSEIQYSLTEETVPDLYTAAPSGDVTNGFTVTNKLGGGEKTIQVEKIWVDAESDSTRKVSTTITLKADGAPATDVNGEACEWTTRAQGSKTFTVPVYANGKKINYTAEETAVQGYNGGAAAQAQETATGFKLVNTIDNEEISVRGQKIWSGGDKDYRPDVTFTLYKNGQPTGQTKTLADLDADGYFSFNNLALYDISGTSCTKNVYTIQESMSGNMAAYYKAALGLVNGVFVFENTFDPKGSDGSGTSVSGSKVWVDGNAAHTGTTITVGLYNGTKKIKTQTVSQKNGKWEFVFDKLEKVDEQGNKIEYSVYEMDGDTALGLGQNGNKINIDGKDYEVSYRGTTIINTLQQDRTNITVTKIWNGPAAGSVAFTVTRQDTGASFTLTMADNDPDTQIEGNVWTKTVTVDKYNSDRAEIVYNVEEANTYAGENGEKLVNLGNYVYEVDRVENSNIFRNTVQQVNDIKVKITKDWKNTNLAVSQQPESIQVYLMRDGVAYGTYEVKAEENWTLTIEGLPRFREDTHAESVYSVQEVGVDPVSGMVLYGHDYYKAEVSSAQTPVGADFELTLTNECQGHYAYVLNLHYSYTDKHGDTSTYSEPGEIQYGVKDESISYNPGSYTTVEEYPGVVFDFKSGTVTNNNVQLEAFTTSESRSLTLENRNLYIVDLYYSYAEEYEPPKPIDPDTGDDDVDIFVSKVWKDDDSDLRPDSISVQLYRNGKAYGDEVTLSENNNWRYTWSGLKDSYTWTVEEVDVPDGYVSESSRVGNRWIITNTLEGTEIKEPETPATALPDTDVPTSDDTGVDLPEPEVPKADAPKTGDEAGLWAMAAAVSGMGLVWLAISGKKRKEEDA